MQKFAIWWGGEKEEKHLISVYLKELNLIFQWKKEMQVKVKIRIIYALEESAHFYGFFFKMLRKLVLLVKKSYWKPVFNSI